MRRGDFSLHIENFTLAELFEIIKQGAQTFELKGIEFDVKSSYAVVKADKALTLFMINTLADNASKFTPIGGSVTIEAVEADNFVEIAVSDTGVGIAAQDLDRVKEKFYKANKQVRGSGIGLAVADEIIKQHNGLLFIESDEGVGTKVVIVLPLYEPVTEEPMVELLPDGATTEIIQTENEEGGEEAAGEVEDNG